MGLLRWGSPLVLLTAGSDLAASDDGRNGTEEGVGRDAELGGGEYHFSLGTTCT